MFKYIAGLTTIGIISGLFGGLVGGGSEILIVPLLTLFGLLGTLKRRIGTSLFMLLPPIGFFAAMKFYKEGHVDIFAALYMGLIFTIFASVSSKYTLKIEKNTLRKIFASFTILAGIYIFFDKEE
tara:strand:- start:979 stop:1353 length:375 start_codon:yes stop_codon:yes gene_type:complete